MENIVNDLYRIKGELVTQIEVAQARLQDVNRQIVEILNKPKEIIAKEK